MAPNASARLLGVSRTRVTNGPAGMVPSYVFVTPGDPGAPLEYEVCFKCHSSWTTLPAGHSDLALLLNPNNASFHPVEGTGRNPNIRPGAFVAPWTWSSTVFCTDCHSSDDTTVRGPHGSVFDHILRGPYTVLLSQRPKNVPYPPTEICFTCHTYDTYANDGAPSAVKGYSRLNRPSYNGGHTAHVDRRGVNCVNCHQVHGSVSLPSLMVTGRNPGMTAYTQTATGGTCTPTCHNARTYTLNYPR